MTTGTTPYNPVQPVEPLAPPQDIEPNVVGYTPATVDPASSGEYEGYQAQTVDPNIGQYEAQQGVVGPESTVAEQMTGLLSRDSDYMKLAETKANQLANRRGLLNSSIAVGAAQGAAIERALPIAQQDATTYQAMDMANLQMENQARQFNAQAEQVIAQFNAGEINQAERDNALAEIQNAQFNATLAQEASIANVAAINDAAAMLATETNKANYAVLSTELQSYLSQLDNNLAMQLAQLEATYDIQQNLDTVNGAIYQQLAAEMGTILANVKDPATAAAQIETLLHSAGVEYAYINGDIRMADFTPSGTTIPGTEPAAPTGMLTAPTGEEATGVASAPTAPDAGVMSYEEWVDSGGLQSISGGDSDDSNWIAMINSQQSYDTASTDAKAAYDEYVQQAQMEALWEQYQANQ